MDYNESMVGFTKLFSTIIHSTIWREDMHVKVLWITMLAMADRNGRVWASLPGLADAARVTIEQCKDAINRLSSPDEYSRTKRNEGRRIEEIDGGWQICNYLKYRTARDQDARKLQVREAVRRFRSRQKPVIGDVIDVIEVSQSKPMQKHIADSRLTTKEREGASRPMFVKPTSQEVDAYILERGYRGFSGEEFVAFYQSKGWVIGKQPMKDWKAAVTTWAKRHGKDAKRADGLTGNTSDPNRPCAYCGGPYPCKCYEEAERG